MSPDTRTLTENLRVAAPPLMTTAELIAALLRVSEHASDLLISPMRPPEVDQNGQLVTVTIPGVPVFVPEDTARIAGDLIGHNQKARQRLQEEGSCDFSYFLPHLGRFRVSMFMQRGSFAIKMRVIPDITPDFASLHLPPSLAEIVNLRRGLVLVTGPAGSGKSSTLAALINAINESKALHVLTIEDPIEFLHRHKKAAVHQRELHRDVPTFAMALRAALRQEPQVILIGELRDRETIELALEAAESGRLILSALQSRDAARAFADLLRPFPPAEQESLRPRMARMIRFIVSQRLLPRKDGSGRVAVFEILKSNRRTRQILEKGEGSEKALKEVMRSGVNKGMQCMEGELEKLVLSGVIDREIASEEGAEISDLDADG